MRVLKNAGLGLAAGSFVLAGSGAAFAGAWDNLGIGSLNLLFAPEKFVVEAGATYVDRNVDYKITSSTGQLGEDITDGSTTERVTPNVWDYRVGVKAQLLDNLNCLGRFNEPFNINEEMDPSWNGRNGGYETKATTLGLDATCAYTFDIDGSSNFRVIAGVKAIDLTYESHSMATVNFGLGRTDYPGGAEVKSDGMAWGWRAGVAYEIPEYALRASLVYDSEVSADLEGEWYMNDLPDGLGGSYDITRPVSASITAPQSVELNVQSGIAPGWLATFGVKWMDWSVIDRLTLVYDDALGGVSTDRDLGFKDGWTVQAGIGHQLTEKLALGSSVQWDRGVGGSYSDNYTFAAGGAYDLNDKVKLSLGGAAIYKTASSGGVYDDASLAGYEYDYDSSWNFAVDTKLRVAF
ncbi:long-chain fatty acid transporter [Pseudovibrio japonicus]|uniref:Long-chain fatty acid transporter n=1 Tax=Pseudovibrio japonicus TaxID=366534 RepID=A0ABQ3ECT8_9HYPH|nr:outer membrane protein transport protein [Pseudovibrio japonicus]GHB30726.1 long-chain fatty acid transporter [Pseudovibrio japonicus]